jgi:hypothetical protein
MSACSSDAPPTITGPSTTTPRATTTTQGSTESTAAVASEEDLIKSRYAAFWDARFAANEEPVDPNAPALREVATGSQLENVVAETAKRKSDGLAFRRPANSVARRSVQVVEHGDGEATVQECSVNDGVLYRVATGEVVDDSVVTHSVEARLRIVDGVWKVESTRLLQKWQGVAGCALSS